jgi:hypothetical protein
LVCLVDCCDICEEGTGTSMFIFVSVVTEADGFWYRYPTRYSYLRTGMPLLQIYSTGTGRDLERRIVSEPV